MASELSFGRLVRARRRALDLTQEELARRVACAPITLRKIEYGTLRPSRQIAERLAAALGVPPEERAAFIADARAVRVEGPADLAPSSPSREQAARPDTPAALAGQVRGYQLGPQIGAGGFGAVYRASQPALGRDVAIKVILPQYADHPEFIRRFEAEAQLVARLEHPHIVPLYDYWREPGAAYLVMRYVRGGALQDLLQQGPLPHDRVLRLIEQVGDALGYAHRAEIIHRDLKPANILVDAEGNAYLTDFGIAKDLGGEASLTADAVFVGSPGYAAPEQIRAEPITAQSDIYALGVLLYELLAGRRPFPGPTPALLLQQHLREPVPPLAAQLGPSAPALDRIIQRAMAKLPSARYPDVAAFLADMRAVLLPPQASAAPAPALVAAPPTTPLPLADGDNPYLGLRAFAEADAPRFFGRESLLQQLLVRLNAGDELERFLAVIGPSGSGKSSVVRAGLIPALRRGGLPGSEHWLVVTLTPGPHPLAELASALLTVAPAGVELDDLLALLRTDGQGLSRAVRRVLPLDPQVELVIVIDQFEELFTLTHDEAARAQLLAGLVNAVLDPRSRTRIVVTLRADFLDRPLHYVDLAELIQRRSELALPLTADDLERAIVGPARSAGLAFEDGLVSALIGAVLDQPGALPLLQHTLHALFLRRAGRALTRSALDELGGVSGALATSAEAVLTALGPVGPAAARQLFLRLTNPGDGGPDTRRRVRQRELQALGADVAAAVAGFGRSRLLIFDHEPETREPTVELAHEALLQAWPRLRDWLEVSREDLRLQQRLAGAAEVWAGAGQDPSFLARGAQLLAYQLLADRGAVALTTAERAYLAASSAEQARQQAEEQDRQARELALKTRVAVQLRAIVGVLAAALLVAVGLSAVALRSRADAVSQGEVAQANLRQSEAGRLAAEASTLLRTGGNSELAALLTLRSLGIQYTPQGDAALAAAELQPYPRRLLTTGTGPVWGVAFAPDGRTLATGGNDGSAQLWDVGSETVIRRLVGHTEALETLAFSPDGARIVTGSDDLSARIWDAQTGRELHRLDGHTGFVYSVAFTPDGRQVVTAGADGTARLWDAQTGRELRRFTMPGVVVRAVAVAPDGATLATGGDDNRVRLWDLRTGQELRQLLGHAGAVTHIAYAPDGRTLLTTSEDKTARLWELQGGEVLRTLAGHSGIVNGAAFAPDGRYVLTGGQDAVAILWDAQTGERVGRFAAHSGFVWDVAFAPDGASLATASFDGTVRLWDSAPRSPLPIMRDPSGMLGIAVAPDGAAVLTGSISGTPTVWDARTGALLRRFVGHQGPATAVAFSPDGQYVLTSSVDKTVRLWDRQTGAELRQFAGQLGSANLNTVAFSPDGRYAVTGDNDFLVRLWDVATGRELREMRHEREVFAVGFSPDGRTILSGAYDGTARLWDVQTGTQLRSFAIPGDGAASAVFSPDGATIFTGSWDGSVRQWDAQTGALRQVLRGHRGQVTGLAVSPDGAYLLSGAGDARLWDLRASAPVRVFPSDTNGIVAVAFSRDGTQVLTSSLDGTMRTWNVDYRTTTAYLCDQLRRDLSDDERAQYTITDPAPTCP